MIEKEYLLFPFTILHREYDFFVLFPINTSITRFLYFKTQSSFLNQTTKAIYGIKSTVKVQNQRAVMS